MSGRRIAIVIAEAGATERVATLLQLAAALLARGHRVTVFAHDEAVRLAAGDGDVARAVARLLRRGVHGGTLDWVVDDSASRRAGVRDAMAPGVVPGDHADLWAFVREADLVLAPGSAS